MSTNHQITYRDAFLGAIQNSGRVLQRIRFPLVITVSQCTGIAHLSAVKSVLQSIYCDRGAINILAQSDTKLMVMFTDDQDALLAYEDLDGRSIQDHQNSVISFKIWHPLDDLGYDVADHHIYVSIQGLPQHLWKKDVVEQILHPYCALDALSEETSKRRDLSSYTTFAWSQQRIAMPRKISLKVLKKPAGESFSNGSSRSREFDVYTLSIQAIGYLCDSTAQCSCNLESLNVRYESTYNPDNAQCYLTDIPDNNDLLDELRFGVVAKSSHEEHGCQKEELHDLISDHVDGPIKIHRLHGGMFMILPSKNSKARRTMNALLEMKSLQIRSVQFVLDRWSTDLMSVRETLSTKVSITLNEVPAHLCTRRIMNFILSPYCAMESKDTCDTIPPACERFKTTAWTNSPTCIPKRIMTALFNITPDEEIIQQGSFTADLRITQMLIDTSIDYSTTISTETENLHCATNMSLECATYAERSSID